MRWSNMNVGVSNLFSGRNSMGKHLIAAPKMDFWPANVKAFALEDRVDSKVASGLNWISFLGAVGAAL